MAVVRLADVVAEAETTCQGQKHIGLPDGTNGGDDVVIDYLGHAKAYAVPTWCSISLAS